MLRAAPREDETKKGKEIICGGKKAAEKEETKEGDKAEDMLGRLNAVWGYAIIKTSCHGSFSAPVRAADTNSMRIKYKP